MCQFAAASTCLRGRLHRPKLDHAHMRSDYTACVFLPMHSPSFLQGVLIVMSSASQALKRSSLIWATSIGLPSSCRPTVSSTLRFFSHIWARYSLCQYYLPSQAHLTCLSGS
jgi:hypothetical protein